MKKLLFALIGFSVLTIQSCKNAPENSPADEQSIESVSSDNGDKVLIRLKPKVGDTQSTLMTMDMQMEGARAMKVNMSAKVDVEVTAKEADIFTYSLNYKSMKMNMDGGGMQINYDSEAKQQEGMGQMIHEQMKPLYGNRMTMKMSDRGLVTDMTMPGTMSTQQTGDFGSLSIPLPEGPVGVGDSWTSERPLEGLGKLKMKMTMKKITVDDVEIATDGEMVDSDGSNVGTFDGIYKLDRNTGLTKDGTMNMNITVEGQPGKMKINFKSL